MWPLRPAKIWKFRGPDGVTATPKRDGDLRHRMPGCQNPKQLREREHRHTGSPRTESGPRLGALPSLGVPTIPPLLTKPLSMTRHRLLRVSASLVKWNWTRREFRNRGTSVVCGVGVGGLGEAGPGPQNPPQPAPAQPTHQQLLWDKLHVELPRPLLRPPVGQMRGSAKGRPFSTPPLRPVPCTPASTHRISPWFT